MNNVTAEAIEALGRYQEFVLSTIAVPPEKLEKYLLLGVLSEIGEYCGKLKKEFRGEVVSREGKLDELGDILWYCIAEAYRTNEQILWENVTQEVVPITGLEVDLETTGAVGAMAVVFTSKEVPWWLKVLLAVQSSAALYNETLLGLAQRNFEKLDGRIARGTLLGSGDKR